MERVTAIATIILLLSSGAVRAQDRSQAPPASAPSTEGAPASEPENEPLPMQRYGETDKACRQWTDGCRSCGRGTDGKAVCSNIGIACQPGEVKCTAHDAPVPK